MLSGSGDDVPNASSGSAGSGYNSNHASLLRRYFVDAHVVVYPSEISYVIIGAGVNGASVILWLLLPILITLFSFGIGENAVDSNESLSCFPPLLRTRKSSEPFSATVSTPVAVAAPNVTVTVSPRRASTSSAAANDVSTSLMLGEIETGCWPRLNVV